MPSSNRNRNRAARSWRESLQSVSTGQLITKVWEEFETQLHALPVRDEYIHSLTYSISTSPQELATRILRRLHSLQDITDYTLRTERGQHYPLPGNAARGPSLAVLRACGQMHTIRNIDLGTTEGTPEHLFEALSNFSNLVHLCVSLQAPYQSTVTSHAALQMPHLTSLSFNVVNWPEAAASLVAKASHLRHLGILETTCPARDRHEALNDVFRSKSICTMDIGPRNWDFVTDEGRLGTDCLPSLEELTLMRPVSETYLGVC